MQVAFRTGLTVFIFFIFEICSGNTLELPQPSSFNEYPQQTIFNVKKRKILRDTPLTWSTVLFPDLLLSGM